MGPIFKNCWEIKGCGRERGGANVAELGECIASKLKAGHSCWAIAGTLCGGMVQGTAAQKEGNCMSCQVYKLYSRNTGQFGKAITKAFPEEDEVYRGALQVARVRGR